MVSKLAVISLGGTISMTEAETGGVVPTLSGEDLVKRFGIQDAGIEVFIFSFRQLAGAQLSVQDLVDVSRQVHELTAAGFTGTVVTQGTDTIEETAFDRGRRSDSHRHMPARSICWVHAFLVPLLQARCATQTPSVRTARRIFAMLS